MFQEVFTFRMEHGNIAAGFLTDLGNLIDSFQQKGSVRYSGKGVESFDIHLNRVFKTLPNRGKSSNFTKCSMGANWTTTWLNMQRLFFKSQHNFLLQALMRY